MKRYIDVIMAGFGGQGVLLIGNLLAYAGMREKLNVTYIPVYGVEMRGGTANCTVVLDEHPIGSPLVREPMSTIILNEPSLDKFQPRLAASGVQIVNASLVAQNLLDAARRTVYIPVNDMAHELGNVKMANMVALGAWLKATGALPLNVVQDALNRVVSAHYAKLIDLDFDWFYNFHKNNGKLFSISAFSRTEVSEYGVLFSGTDNLLTGFVEKPKTDYTVSMGIYMANREILKHIPDNVAYGFDHLMLALIQKKQEVLIHRHSGYWLDIGRPDDYIQAIDELELLKEKLMPWE